MPRCPTCTTTRREFLWETAAGFTGLALTALLDGDGFFSGRAHAGTPPANPLAPRAPHFQPRAKACIFLYMYGGPSQMDLFDYKPAIESKRGIELPSSVRMGQRITTMTSGQKSFPVAPSLFRFARHGQSGAWMSELLPHTASIADDICLIRSMQTEAINHDPAITFVQTGSQLSGRPSMGSWVAYGLGSENQDLPAFVVLLSRGRTDQPL
jgi:hypothetical protein